MRAASVGAEAALLWGRRALGAAHLVNNPLTSDLEPTNSGVIHHAQLQELGAIAAQPLVAILSQAS